MHYIFRYLFLILTTILILFWVDKGYSKTIRVAVIDTGYFTDSYGFKICDNGESQRDFTGEGMDDKSGHGQNITHLIVKQIKDADYCIIPIKAFSEKGFSYTTYGILYAMLADADVINMSFGGKDFLLIEYLTILTAIKKGVGLFAAAGNYGNNLNKHCNFYPACYDKKIIVIGNYDGKKYRSKTSNYGNKVVDGWENGINATAGGVTKTGTSQATAIATGKFVQFLHNKLNKGK